MKTKDEATAATQITGDRTIDLYFWHRVVLGAVLSRQSHASITKAIGREATDDDAVALYSIRRKTMVDPEELIGYQRNFGGQKQIDMDAIIAIGDKHGMRSVVLDSFERRLLRTFLNGWLKLEGSLADRDWALPVLEQCLDKQ